MLLVLAQGKNYCCLITICRAKCLVMLFRIFELLETEPSIPIAGGVVLNSITCQGHIEFRNVEFSYPSRKDIKVLDDFNLRIFANTTVALVGQSGSGIISALGQYVLINILFKGKVPC